jgi:hypothetical protein
MPKSIPEGPLVLEKRPDLTIQPYKIQIKWDSQKNIKAIIAMIFSLFKYTIFKRQIQMSDLFKIHLIYSNAEFGTYCRSTLCFIDKSIYKGKMKLMSSSIDNLNEQKQGE